MMLIIQEPRKAEEMGSLLKECPFCGDKDASIRTEYDNDGSNTTWKYVECIKCRSRTAGKWFSGTNDCPIFYEEVRDQWNQRA